MRTRGPMAALALAAGMGIAALGAAPGAARAQVMGFMEVDSAKLRPMTQAQCFTLGEQMLRELGGRNITRTGSVLWADLDDALVGLMCRPDLRHVLTATNADTEAKLVDAQRQIRQGLTRVYERR